MPDLLRLRFSGWDVDVFVNDESPYDREFTNRSVPIETGHGTVRVVTPEDLLIHKMIKLRTDRRRLLQDLADMQALAAGRVLDREYLHRWLPGVEANLVDTLVSADAEQLARRILGT